MTADTYSNTLGVLLMGTGNDNNSWGNNQNSSVFQILEDAIANALTSSVTGGTLDLSGSPPPAAPSQVRYAALIFSGVLASAQIVQVPNLQKFWWVKNATSGAYGLTIKTPSGSASSAIPQNSGWQLVYCDGANNIVVFPFNTKTVQMPDGAVSAPAYSNVNEPTSGFYRAGTQDWRFAINGVDVLQITGAGAGTPSIVNILSPGSLQIAGGQVIPPGTVLDYSGIDLPSGGYVWADNTPYSRTNPLYTALFAAITKTSTGNTHTSTTIDNIPVDLRGKGLEGAYIEGSGIPTGTTIAAIGAASITLSQATTTTLVGTAIRILPYGQGDGATTFTVTDRRYRTGVGRDNMNNNSAGRSSLYLGGRLITTGGEETHALIVAELAVHGHVLNDPTHSHGVSQDGFGDEGTIAIYTAPDRATGFLTLGGTLPTGSNSTGTRAASTGITLNTTGSGTAHNTMQPFAITNSIVKL